MTGCSTNCLTLFFGPALREKNRDVVEGKAPLIHGSACVVCANRRRDRFEQQPYYYSTVDMINVNWCEIDCAWWTACSEAPSVTTLSWDQLGHLCLFYICALLRTEIDGLQALMPHRHTQALFMMLVSFFKPSQVSMIHILPGFFYLNCKINNTFLVLYSHVQ